MRRAEADEGGDHIDAVAVRDAYLAADPGDDGAATVTVRSPVTGEDYEMSCSGAVVTTCTGGNDASVVLY